MGSTSPNGLVGNGITALYIDSKGNLWIGSEKKKGLTKYNIKKDPSVYYSTILNTKNNNNIKLLACCFNQMGMQASSAIASKIISTFSPRELYVTGICAGIKKSGINIGDIPEAERLAVRGW